MGYLTTDIARIPSTGFDWYIYVLSDGWIDPLRDEMDKNFRCESFRSGGQVPRFGHERQRQIRPKQYSGVGVVEFN